MAADKNPSPFFEQLSDLYSLIKDERAAQKFYRTVLMPEYWMDPEHHDPDVAPLHISALASDVDRFRRELIPDKAALDAVFNVGHLRARRGELPSRWAEFLVADVPPLLNVPYPPRRGGTLKIEKGVPGESEGEKKAEEKKEEELVPTAAL